MYILVPLATIGAIVFLIAALGANSLLCLIIAVVLGIFAWLGWSEVS